MAKHDELISAGAADAGASARSPFEQAGLGTSFDAFLPADLHAEPSPRCDAALTRAGQLPGGSPHPTGYERRSAQSAGPCGATNFSAYADAAVATASLQLPSAASGGRDAGASTAASVSDDGGDGGSAAASVSGTPASGSEGDASPSVALESRHLWLGNVLIETKKSALESLFGRFGPLEAVRVFPDRSFAFVNFISVQHAVAAKNALHGHPAPSVSGHKPLVIRYQQQRPQQQPLPSLPLARSITLPHQQQALPLPCGRSPGDEIASGSGAAGAAPADRERANTHPGYTHNGAASSADAAAGGGEPGCAGMRGVCGFSRGSSSVGGGSDADGTPPSSVSGSASPDSDATAESLENRPSRHLWLGNIPRNGNKAAMEELFSRFGPLESVCVFPERNFAFVNFKATQHSIAAMNALHGHPAPSVTGNKPLVIRYQQHSTRRLRSNPPPPANELPEAASSPHASSAVQHLLSRRSGGAEGGVHAGLGGREPATLASRLNPRSAHFDPQMAARYRLMGLVEKNEAWAQDRAAHVHGGWPGNAAFAPGNANGGLCGMGGMLDPAALAAAGLLSRGPGTGANGLSGMRRLPDTLDALCGGQQALSPADTHRLRLQQETLMLQAGGLQGLLAAQQEGAELRNMFLALALQQQQKEQQQQQQQHLALQVLQQQQQMQMQHMRALQQQQQQSQAHAQAQQQQQLLQLLQQTAGLGGGDVDGAQLQALLQGMASMADLGMCAPHGQAPERPVALPPSRPSAGAVPGPGNSLDLASLEAALSPQASASGLASGGSAFAPDMQQPGQQQQPHGLDELLMQAGFGQGSTGAAQPFMSSSPPHHQPQALYGSGFW